MPTDQPAAAATTANTDLVGLDAIEMAAGLRNRSFSAVELLAAHLQRIEQVNPVVNAVVTLDADGAQKAAVEADRRLAAGEPLGPLHGLPIAFKDTHATAGMRTTHGSARHSGLIPTQDDEIVRRILAAGAIRLGKTNVPEYAAGSHTFNDLFGITRNPRATGRSAGGSSGGAAAALAAGMQPIADGSDMGGSLRNPASFCGVVGLRPTPGRVPRPAASLGWSTMSVAGPMGRTVADVALLLSVIATRHPHDPLSLQHRALAPVVAPVELAGLRVAWAPTLGDRIPVDRQVLGALEPAVRLFESAGAFVELACPDLGGADQAFRTIRAAEFAATLGDELLQDPTGFKDDLARNIREGIAVTARDLLLAQAELTRLYRAGNDFFESYDVLLAPVSQVPPFDAHLLWPTMIDGTPQHDYLSWMASCYLVSTLGTPAISVPAGATADGLPIGLQIITRAGADPQLLSVAAAFATAVG